ncbi:MAG: threonylcarbamoyl-AMP synthase [Deltaproteobacteria bacterium]|nr:threonylcarbamoyl-AMP synthase [Deltaproteobacteria bacterium]MBW1967381.1 threonylcarbamoyl-AMP synthase [Deltaproteobacteria bacterium]MBW2098728.1 threonylcarbamoyl-AMP synthase [Deltaproteobacteria bacterium]PXF52151.1 MAG: threonylcarbamoyl-AMP synthase [Deltaproteobacteria bacterium]RKX59387.1 MAG: threonylcarbamoyl-AMP synthase [Thermodesulfobacteriota bacterium]
MLLEIDPKRPSPRQINMVAEILRRGEIIVYPTDTCYGIGADIFNKKAIGRIYQIKGLHKSTPFSFVCANLRDISRYAFVTDYAYRILKRFLPGPYTFILEGSREVPKMMLTKRRTVGIRIPDHPVCKAIADALGNPLISTSAGIGNEPVWSDPKEINEVLGKRLAMVIDCGIIPAVPSSVISLVNDETLVLRKGKGDVSAFIEKKA